MHEVHEEVANNKAPKGKSLHVYREICDHLKPVLHHFFLERWTSPAAWFSRRLAYTSSVGPARWLCAWAEPNAYPQPRPPTLT